MQVNDKNLSNPTAWQTVTHINKERHTSTNKCTIWALFISAKLPTYITKNKNVLLRQHVTEHIKHSVQDVISRRKNERQTQHRICDWKSLNTELQKTVNWRNIAAVKARNSTNSRQKVADKHQWVTEARYGTPWHNAWGSCRRRASRCEGECRMDGQSVLPDPEFHEPHRRWWTSTHYHKHTNIFTKQLTECNCNKWKIVKYCDKGPHCRREGTLPELSLNLGIWAPS